MKKEKVFLTLEDICPFKKYYGYKLWDIISCDPDYLWCLINSGLLELDSDAMFELWSVTDYQ